MQWKLSSTIANHCIPLTITEFFGNVNYMFRSELPKIKIPGTSDVKLQKAKEFPILSLYTGELKKLGKIHMGKCPFHAEDTPSFAIYTETNTYNCFGGCGGGDVIKFYQLLHNCSFAEAVEELSK